MLEALRIADLRLAHEACGEGNLVPIEVHAVVGHIQSEKFEDRVTHMLLGRVTEGKVEAGVKYVKGNFFVGRQESDVEAVRRDLRRW